MLKFPRSVKKRHFRVWAAGTSLRHRAVRVKTLLLKELRGCRPTSLTPYSRHSTSGTGTSVPLTWMTSLGQSSGRVIGSVLSPWTITVVAHRGGVNGRVPEYRRRGAQPERTIGDHADLLQFVSGDHALIRSAPLIPHAKLLIDPLRAFPGFAELPAGLGEIDLAGKHESRLLVFVQEARQRLAEADCPGNAAMQSVLATDRGHDTRSFNPLFREAPVPQPAPPSVQR